MQPLLVLWGEEEFLLKKALKEIESSLIPSQAKDYNLTIFYGHEASSGQIIESAKTLPCFSKHRMVVVRDPQKLPLQDKQALVSYADNPSKTTSLVFVSETIEPNDPLFSALKDKAVFKTFRRLEKGSLTSWIKDQVQQRKKDIDPDAIQVLKEDTGADLSALSNSIEKLTLFIGRGQKITKKDVEEVIGRSASSTGFELLDAISTKKASKAFSILRDLLLEGKKSAEIIGLLTWHLRKQKSAAGPDSRRFQKGLEEILKTDIEIKSGKMKEDIALEVLIARLILVLDQAAESF